MKSILRWLSSCHFPVLMLLSLLPAALILLSVAFPGAPAAAPALLLGCLPLSMLCATVSGRRRLPAAVLFAVLLFLLSAAVLPLRAQPALLLVPTLSCAMLFVSLPLIARGLHGISPALYLLGIVSHILAYMVFRPGASDSVSPLLSRYLAIVFSLYLPLFLLAMNRITLDNASLSRYRLPASMRQANLLFTLSFLAFALLIASLPAAARFLSAAWLALRRSIRALGALLARLLPDAPYAGGGGMGGGMLPLTGDTAVEEAGRLSLLLEQLTSLLAAAVLIAGGIIFLRLLLAAAFRLLREAFARLRRFASSASEDYVDEITDTRGEEGLREGIAFLRPRRRPASAVPDTPAGIVRHHYAHLLNKHRSWSESSTARENLPPEAAGIYERARYSQHAVSQAEADDFRRQT